MQTLTAVHADAEYIIEGPLLRSCKLSPSDVKSNIPVWKDLGDSLIKNLGFPARDSLDDIQRHDTADLSTSDLGVSALGTAMMHWVACLSPVLKAVMCIACGAPLEHVFCKNPDPGLAQDYLTGLLCALQAESVSVLLACVLLVSGPVAETPRNRQQESYRVRNAGASRLWQDHSCGAAGATLCNNRKQSRCCLH